MRSFISAVTIALALSACAGHALAMPRGDAAQPDGTASGAHTSAAAAASAPASPAGDGIGAVTIALLGTGGVLVLGGAGAIGALVGRHHQGLSSSGA